MTTATTDVDQPLERDDERTTHPDYAFNVAVDHDGTYDQAALDRVWGTAMAMIREGRSVDSAEHRLYRSDGVRKGMVQVTLIDRDAVEEPCGNCERGTVLSYRRGRWAPPARYRCRPCAGTGIVRR